MKTLKHIPEACYNKLHSCSCNNGNLRFIEVRSLFSNQVGVCVFCPDCYRAGRVGKGNILAEAVDEAVELWNDRLEELDCMYARDSWYVTRGYF